MVNSLLELLVVGKIPGTQTYINFEAFLQGMVVGLAVLLVAKIIARKLGFKLEQFRLRRLAQRISL